MRAIALVGILLGACVESGDPLPPGPGPNPTGMGPYCDATTPCTGSDVCARDHECLAPDQARSVMVRWTVQGQPASASSCAPLAGLGELQIAYSADATGELTGFAPLMCSEGQFFVDVWPARFDHVRVSAGASGPVYAGAADLPAGNADVTVDLQPQ